MPRFQCQHCGFCCTNKNLQAGMTLGDIQRIVALTKIPAEQLVKDNVLGLIATGTENKNIFETDLGLIYPCRLRKEERCTIYPSRPLNCHMFPAGILSEIKAEDVKKLLGNDFKCAASLAECKKEPVNNILLSKYRQELGKIILEESRITDKFMQENGFIIKIDVTKHKDFKGFDKDEKKAFCQKLFLAESMIDDKLRQKLAESIKEELKNHNFRTLQGIPFLE